MSETVSPSKLVKAGLERLAFGSSNDAVYLAFSEEMPSPEKFLHSTFLMYRKLKRSKAEALK